MLNTSTVSKFNIILCELFNPYYHGSDEYSDPCVNSHYLIYGKYTLFQSCVVVYDEYTDEDEDNNYMDENNNINYSFINQDIETLKNSVDEYIMNNYTRKTIRHPLIRNYKNIIFKDEYIKQEIAECIILSGGESVAILKTFWIKIIQRTWKRIFKEKMKILLFSNTFSIWPG